MYESRGILDSKTMSETESDHDAPMIEVIPRTQSSNAEDGSEDSSSTVKRLH